MFIRADAQAFEDERQRQPGERYPLATILRRTLVGHVSNIHRPGAHSDIYAFSSPRSGSTMLMELIDQHPRMKVYNEPLNIHDPIAWKELGCGTWKDLCSIEDREAIYKQYFSRLSKGKIKAKNRAFYKRDRRSLTTRNYFKVIHGGEDLAGWFESELSAQVLFLLRHPIAVAMSHWRIPRFPYYFLNEDFARKFDDKEKQVYTDALERGDPFEMAIVNWCIQNKFRCHPQLPDTWTRVSYEEIVMRGTHLLAELGGRLSLETRAMEQKGLLKASKTVRPRANDTRQLIEADDPGSKAKLISRWRQSVTQDQEADAFEIMHAFNIDYYEFGRDMTKDKYLVLPANTSLAA